MPPVSRHCFPYRPNDFMYDPIFTVSGPTDHYKAVLVAKMSAAKFQICPIFPNMFSDLPNYPRVQLVKRRDKPVPSYQDIQKSINKKKDPYIQRPVDVRGSDRARFCVTVMNFPPKDSLPFQESPTFTIEQIKNKATEEVTNAKTRDVEVETIFRESIAQTDPWEPPYKVTGKGDPEVLKLDFLKWGSGLPAGMHEIQLIERARMKVAWEKYINPNILDKQSIQQFREYMQALEMDEWAFREQEISEIQGLRLQLLENMLNEIHDMSNARNLMKMNHVIERIQKQKEEKLAQMRRKSSRELRKLEVERRGFQKRYKEMNVIDEHHDKKSEIYAPLMRHGEHPKRWHLVIDEKLKQYRAQFIGVENISTLPKWLDQATRIDKRTLYSNWPKRRICIRETKWTAPVLKTLHDELRDLRKGAENRPLSLRTKLKQAIEEAHTPEVEGIPIEKEHLYQAIIVLQKVIKGRAAQATIYEGRDTCKELIQELKHSKGLMKNQKERKRRDKFKVKTQQREETIQMKMVEKLQGSLGKLQGIVVGSLLDFLNKELRRLLEERKAHAMCLINERERYKREAVEAGRRQKELRRRREHDEMFKQIVKITQESVDVYLKDIITEGMEFCSKEEATDYIEKLAVQIENETDESYNYEPTIDEQDELIANLVLHFVLPDVQKKIVREKISNIQKHRLKSIHDSIYSKIEDLPAPVYPEATSEEIVADILEELIKKVEDEIEWNIQERELHALDLDLIEEMKVEEVPKRKSMGSARSKRISVQYKDYPDPMELYMSQLLYETVEDESEEGFDLHHYQGDEDLTFKNATLATIPEVDNESSVKD
ncbi:unnamed protein product [Psylliodes chrysocephalus]|uniref:Cilia- and flagella-associated protein 91 n=1 Tax=Psylliodes chrysocephalus TaxID=3402493 RepID=A0A9P0DAJ1_9CUCU|nr:unnamed protein product [Psylliodes chrysocephala]